MGFFFLEDENPTAARKAAKTTGGYSLDFLAKHKCEVCPLNKQPGLEHPYMEPSGSDQPLIYILGEAPGAEEDHVGRQFVGESGEALRLRIPPRWLSSIRWNNTVNCRPPQNRDPSAVELACCRPFIVEDIENSKPEAIFGFGNVPLHWAIGQLGIGKWSGRRIPIQVGRHKCWYYAFMHPSAIIHQRYFDPTSPNSYGCEAEFALAVHLKRAFAEVADGLPEPAVHTPEMAMQGIAAIRGDKDGDLDQVLDFLDRADNYDGLTGFDYEANALRPYNRDSKILTVGLATVSEAISFAWQHRQSGWSERDFNVLQTEWKRWLHKARCRKISFSTYEMEWSAVKFGSDCLRSGDWEDAQSQAYLLDGRHGMLSLDILCLQYFGFNLKAISNVDRARLDDTSIDKVLSYNALDAKYHLNLFIEQDHRIGGEGLDDVYAQQMRRVPTMILTQMLGVPVDQSRVDALHDKYSSRLRKIEAELDQLKVCQQLRNAKGVPYRPMAERDVKAAFEMLGEKIETNNEAAIEKFYNNDDPDVADLARLTVEWRKANKVLSTYIEPVKLGSKTSKLHDDGQLHPIIALHKTTTWRTSSEDVNIQNYPKRTDSKETRQILNPSIIKSSSPIKVVSFDFAGIQARNVAMESLDRELIKAFHSRYDIHKDWMEIIARRCPYWAEGKQLANDPKYQKSKRHEAKNKFVFPTFFGAHFTTLANQHLHIDERDAQWLQEKFKDRFSGVARWHKKVHRDYLRLGYVAGLAQFRRYAPVDMNERINAPIQADEALIVTDAMNRLSELGEPQFQATLEIHDDLTFLWPRNKIDEYAEVVIDHMVNTPFEWAHVVPMEIEMSIGEDWAALEEVGKFASDTWKGGVPKMVAAYDAIMAKKTK